MTRAILRSLILSAALSAPVLAQQPTATKIAYDRAMDAWQRGYYPYAFDTMIKVLSANDGAPYFEPIALLTGELFRTTELARDGRVPRWSPGGSFVAYELGTGPTRITTILDMKASHRIVATIHGGALVFAPGDARAAYLAASDSAIVVRDLRTQAERRIPDRGLIKVSIAWSVDGKSLYVLGAKAADARKPDIFAIAIDGAAAPVTVSSDDSVKSNLIVVPGGRYLAFSVGGRNPIAAASTGRGGRAGGGFGARAGSIGVLDLQSHSTLFLAGSEPSVAANGSALTFLGKSGAEFTVNVLPLGNSAAPSTTGVLVAKHTTDSLANPSLSPSGMKVAYQMMPEHDWEVYVAGRDGSGEIRVTREIQHDVLPKFLSETRLFALMGEPRHRRSYLYDISTDPPTRTRLFDNNTTRTIAPEYEWAASPDGTKLLIVAERDGNTIDAIRGVYEMDLTQKISMADLLNRLSTNLAIEKKLRADGTRAFALIAPEVKQRLETVTTSRIYSYEKALFDFDSKYITKPGNLKARQFLIDTYRSFGYEPTVQEFDARAGGAGGNGAPTAPVHTANVYVTLTGTVNPELIYVVSSHFDSRAEGPGADDDASGTAALLEAARALAQHPLPCTVIFASFTGEEAGLLGSREFVRQATANKWHVVGALNNDMIGWANDQRMDNTIRYSNAGIRDIQHAAAFLFTDLVTYDAKYYKSTDAQAFYDGWGDIVGGIGSYPVLGNPHYHMPHDNLEYLNHQQITETSKTTVATIMLLASSPSRLNDLTLVNFSGGNARVQWTPSPEKGVHKYLVRYTAGDGPEKTITVTEPKAAVDGVVEGSVIAVKAVNDQGFEGWDWAYVTVRREE